MIGFELDIPSLTQDEIQMNNSFNRVREVTSSSMIDELILIEMLIILINSFVRTTMDLTATLQV